MDLGCYVLKDTTLNDVSLLALPEHHIRLSWDAPSIKDNGAWGLFSFLKFDVVRYKDVCK